MPLTFADVEIDLDAHRMLRGGDEVSIEPRVFDLLVHLARRPGQVVDRDSLLAEVWDGRIVSDAAIASAVKSARQAIGDDGRAQRWIQTVHGRGYRFAGDVDEDLPSRAAGPTSPTRSPCLLVLPITGEVDPAVAARLKVLRMRIEALFLRIPLLKLSALAPTDGEQPAVEALHREHGVTHLLEGVAISLGDEVAITLRLLDTERSQALASLELTLATGADMAGIEHAVTEVVRNFEPRLARSIYESVRQSGGPDDPRTLYLEASGMLAVRGWAAESFEAAAALLRRSLMAADGLNDPFPEAAAYLSLLLALGHRLGLLLDREQVVGESIAMGERALAEGDADSGLFGFVGCAFCDLGLHDRGLPLLEQAIVLNAGNAQAHVALGAARILLGELEGAIEALEHGIGLSPLDKRLAFWRAGLASAYLFARNLDAARDAARQACREDPRLFIPRVVLAATELVAGDPAGSARALDEARTLKADLGEPEVRALVGPELAEALLSP